MFLVKRHGRDAHATASDQRPGAAELVALKNQFDVAVRLHRAPAYLGVAFETLPEANWIDMQFDQPSGLAFAHQKKHALVISAPLDELEAASRTPSDFLKAFSDQGAPNRRLFLPAAPLPTQYPATYRWRYCISSALA